MWKTDIAAVWKVHRLWLEDVQSYLRRANATDGSPKVSHTSSRPSSSVSDSLQAIPRPRPSTPRSTETSSSPPPCRRPSCSATQPATRCPARRVQPRWCTSPWASCPDLKPRASTSSSRSTGEQRATLLQPWPSYHTQVQWPLRHYSFCFCHNVMFTHKCCCALWC